MGDSQSARQFRAAAQALSPPVHAPAPLHAQLSRAHSAARQAEKKLEAAVLKFETMSQQLESQRAHVGALKSELEKAQHEH
eukprot:5424650-Pyramimonas_sp.AAC.1